MMWPPCKGIGLQVASSAHSTWGFISISISTPSWLHLEFLLGLRDRFWLLVVTTRGLNHKTNRASVRQSRPEGIPPFGILLFSFLPVYCPNFCSIDKGRNGIFIAEYSCKAESNNFLCNMVTYERKAWKGQNQAPKTSPDTLPYA